MFGNKNYECRDSQFDGVQVGCASAVFFISAFAGGAIGAGIDESIGAVDQAAYEAQKNEINELDELIDGGYEDLVREKDSTEERIGEISITCSRLIANYMPNGVLDHLDYDVAAEQIASEPENPCGESLVEINVLLQSTRDYQDVTAKLEKLGSNNDVVSRRQEMGELPEGDSLVEGSLAGLALGSVIGGLFAYFPFEIRYVLSSRRKERKNR